MRRLLAALLLVASAALAGCGLGDDDEADAPVTIPAPETAYPEGSLADSRVCDLVRQGIDAFNLGDLDGTVEKFEEAVEPSRRLARRDGSDEARDLRDAVRYYAELPADDYPEAAESSPEFARWKDVTLTTCAYEGPPVPETDGPLIA